MYRSPNKQIHRGKNGRYHWAKGSGRKGYASRADVDRILGNGSLSPSSPNPSGSSNLAPISATPSASSSSKSKRNTLASYNLQTPRMGIDVRGGLYEDIFDISIDKLLYAQMKEGNSVRINKSYYSGNDIIDILERKINLMIRRIVVILESRIGSANFGGESKGIVPSGGTGQLRRTSLTYLNRQIAQNRHFNFRLRLGFPVKYAKWMNEKLTHQLRHPAGHGKYSITGSKSKSSFRRGHYRRVIDYDASGKEIFGYTQLNDTSAETHFFEKILSDGRSEFKKTFPLIISRVERDYRDFFDENLIDFGIDRFIITPVGII